ncbi:MAG: ATP-binding protein [Methanophagales archaeon]|nr:ATP-binding protein [Methanophagales archaeon]
MAEDLAKTVIHNKTTVVKGYRRVGKSSLVCSMSNILAKKKKYILLHAEVVARHSEEELEKSLSSNFEDTYHRLGLKPPKYIKKFNKLLSDKLMKIAEIESITGTIAPSPSVSVGQTRSKEQTQLKLWDLFDGVIKAASQIKKPIIIVLDEVQNIIEVTKYDQNFKIRDFQELLRYLLKCTQYQMDAPHFNAEWRGWGLYIHEVGI